MGGFELSTGVSPDKVFLVTRNDLVNRIDPYYYKGSFNTLRKKLLAKGFIRLGTFVDSWNRGDGPRDGFYTENSELGVYFLRVNNLKNHTIELEDVKYINRIIHDTKLKRAQVTAGNVIFAISGTKDNLGTVSIIPENIKEANLNSALVKFELNNRIDKKFFCILFGLDFVRTQIEFTGKGAAQNNLNNDEINSFLLPNLDLITQKSLVKTYEDAIEKEKHKEQQAQALLDGIDGYLLNELGITLPQQDNRLEKRIFTVPFSEVTGGRIDPDVYFTKHFKIEGGKYANSPLFKLANVNKGQSITSDIIVAGDCPVIAGGQSSPYSHNIANYQGNVITVSASGAYAGFVWYHDYPIFASDCSVIQSKNETILNTLYLAELLKTKQKEIYNLQQGAGQPHVYSRDLMQQNIPLPPIEKQNEIATHITQIRAQAKQLQQDAAELLANAKAEIERMILGEA